MVRFEQIQQVIQVVGLGHRQSQFFQKRLEILLHTLLGMEAYGVCWAVFSHLQCVCSVLEIILSLLEPLSGHTQAFVGLGHTILSLRVKLVG